MGAADYQVGNAPQGASYSAPLVDFSQFADIPESYFKGTQRKRALEMQKPILDPETGEPVTDAKTVAKELMRRGGAEYSKDMIPFLQKQPFFDELLRQQQKGQPQGSDFDTGATPPRRNPISPQPVPAQWASRPANRGAWRSPCRPRPTAAISTIHVRRPSAA